MGMGRSRLYVVPGATPQVAYWSHLAGFTAGVALGMMMAPKKGADLRTDMLGFLDDLNARACDLIDQGKQKLSDLASSFGDGQPESASKNSEGSI